MDEARKASLDFGKAFGFVFADKDWVKKVLLGGLFVLLSLLLVGIPFLLGYYRKVFLAAAADPDAPLPEWEPGKDFGDGLPVLGAILCYMIPTWIVVIVLSLVPCVGLCIAVPLSLLVTALLPAALTNLFVRGEFASIFDFDWIFKYVRENLPNYLLAIVASLVAGVVAGLGILLCLIGVAFTSFWARLVTFHAFAQVYRAANPPVAEAAPPPAPEPAPQG